MTEDAITNVVNIVEFHSGSAGRGRFGLLGGVPAAPFAGDPGTSNKSNATGMQAVIPWSCVGRANAPSLSRRQGRAAAASADAGSERAA